MKKKKLKFQRNICMNYPTAADLLNRKDKKKVKSSQRLS